MWPWLLNAPWVVFSVWWAVRALSTARTVRAEGARQRIATAALAGGGALLLLAPPAQLCQRLWPTPTVLLWVALAGESAGIAFAIVAREYLGAMWSGRVTLKADHQLVQSGPYRWARHPIYTGVLTALVAVVVARGVLAGVLGFVLIAAALGRKMVSEEALLRDHFGAAYDDYRRKVRAIIPFIL